MRQRGSLKLFEDYRQPPEVAAPHCEMTALKGRSANLIDERNELLLHRYYWHNRRETEPGVRMSYNSLLRILRTEFFLETRTIVNLIDENYAQLQLIRREYSDHTDVQVAKEFAKKFCWLVW